ncbi:histone-lysine N-methyltransferase SETMAR [Trichonephila clavipes]|uniref:Histone-lysine N-methyltransferase SETMAR n=1 Tax=Trichonephila clavipes TaxID=2585209 RepID=A0A8X6RI61_TRICX|nr:histone-lysine N-methyltransferase SETMAR [Trichonephila clavipes]
MAFLHSDFRRDPPVFLGGLLFCSLAHDGRDALEWNECRLFRGRNTKERVPCVEVIGKNASQDHKNLCAVYGDEALKKRQCQNRFAKFRSGGFSLKDEKRSGRPVEVDDDVIKAIFQCFSNHMTLTTSYAASTRGETQTSLGVHFPYGSLRLYKSLSVTVFSIWKVNISL